MAPALLWALSACVELPADALAPMDTGGDDEGGRDSTDPAHAIAIPAGPFDSVAVGAVHGCALLDGQASCFGFDGMGLAAVPDIADFVALTAGVGHTCGLRAGGAVHCWGDDSSGQSTVPDALFVSVDAGLAHTCGVTTGGEILCWGNNVEGETDVPDGGPWSQVSAGGYHTMALGADGDYACWGFARSCLFGLLPVGVGVAAGFEHSVLLFADGTVSCGGFGGEGRCPEGRAISAVSAGGYHTCGLALGETDTPRTLQCWPGGSEEAPNYPIGETFTSIDAGLNYTCGVDGDAEVRCWGWHGEPWDGLN